MSYRYRFEADDMHSPMGLSLLGSGHARLILAIDGLGSGTCYETICYVPNGEDAIAIADRLNQSAFCSSFAEILRRAKVLAEFDGRQAKDDDDD